MDEFLRYVLEKLINNYFDKKILLEDMKNIVHRLKETCGHGWKLMNWGNCL